MTDVVPLPTLPPRHTHLLCGPEQWLRDQCQELNAEQGLAVEIDLPGFQHVRARQVHAVLGQTFATVVLDWRQGWHTNHLSAVAGTLRAGGVLIILLAEPTHWAATYSWNATADPFASRLFPFWLMHMREQGAHWHTPDHPPFPTALLPDALLEPLLVESQALREQRAVVEVITGLPDSPHHHLLLTAGRGHGKSRALVQAALQMAEKRQVVMLAPLAAHIAVLRDYLEHELSSLGAAGVSAAQRRESIHLCTWDTLPADVPHDAILLVDEAAMFGLPRLRHLAKQARWRVFATTTDGYEGSGQGFRLRFLPWLRRQRGGTIEQYLQHPMRWSAADPVARQLATALLMTTHWPAWPASTSVSAASVRFGTVTAEQILADAGLRAQWSALLTAAHYQTRPDDLRQAIDDPSVRQWALWHGDHLVGLCLVLDEPALPEDLTGAVWRGDRRPGGQQAKQTLVGQLGHRDAGRWHGWRIWRLVVHPELSGQGWGRHLVTQVVQRAQQAGCDYVAASYGMTDELVHFWQYSRWPATMAWALVRIGLQDDAASGARSALTVCALTTEVRDWTQAAESTVATWLPEQDEYRTAFSDSLMWALLRGLPCPELTAAEQQRLRHWCASQQPIEALRPVLLRCLWRAEQQDQLASWSAAERGMALHLLWRRAPWAAAQQRFGLANQKAFLVQLKTAFKSL